MSKDDQSTMFDLSGKDLNAYWVDEKEPLFVPNNPVHYMAHKLQIAVKKLEIQLDRNPAQFNSKNYLDLLEKYERYIKAIKEGHDEILESGEVDQGRQPGRAPEMGAGVAASVDTGVSTKNPLAG